MCIDRLYFSKSVCVGDSVLPEWKVREYLQLMDEASVEAVMNNLKNTTEHIKNLIGYIISVMLNSVIEVNSRWLTVPILDIAGKYTGFEVN